MDDKVLVLLSKLLSEVEEIKNIVKAIQSNSKTSSTKITVIGNRPQKTASIKGIDSNEDFNL